MLAAMALTAGVVAILLGAEVSLMFGQLTGIAAAALGGACVCGFLTGPNGAARGAIPVYVVLVGGLAYVGAIEPEQPVLGILLAAAAPLSLWGLAAGPGARLSGGRAWVVQIFMLTAWLAVAAALVGMRGAGGEEW
jgi:hypothetical protein